MLTISCEVAIVGGGPAALAAAAAAKKRGAKEVLVLERDSSLGGILQQCIHPGFGLSYFNEELTGPEYSSRFAEEAIQKDTSFMLDTMVLSIDEHTLICANKQQGMVQVTAKSIVLAMGCRERTRAQIQIPGSRPAGVYTAGTAQRLINRQNVMVGKKIVILGSGDIGMIMARRLTLEGAEVVAVVELLDFLAGLTRNRVQCLEDFSIPLLLSHTVTEIVGVNRLEGVYISKVDPKTLNPIKESEYFVECDTLLLSVGLIPENELTRTLNISMDRATQGPKVNQYQQTSCPSVFACGNVVHVNDLVDNVSIESIIAGTHAAEYALGESAQSTGTVLCEAAENVRYICPQAIALSEKPEDVTLYFRGTRPLGRAKITVSVEGKVIRTRRVTQINPGEMEKITISTADLEDGQPLSISVEEVR